MVEILESNGRMSSKDADEYIQYSLMAVVHATIDSAVCRELGSLPGIQVLAQKLLREEAASQIGLLEALQNVFHIQENGKYLTEPLIELLWKRALDKVRVRLIPTHDS